MTNVPVFDGHNDFLLRLQKQPGNRDTIWLKGDGTGQLDLPRMQAGGFAGGFFAVWCPSPEHEGDSHYDDDWKNPPYDVPLPEALSLDYALPIAVAEIGHLMWMERTGTLSICRSVIEAHGGRIWHETNHAGGCSFQVRLPAEITEAPK